MIKVGKILGIMEIFFDFFCFCGFLWGFLEHSELLGALGFCGWGFFLGALGALGALGVWGRWWGLGFGGGWR